MLVLVYVITLIKRPYSEILITIITPLNIFQFFTDLLLTYSNIFLSPIIWGERLSSQFLHYISCFIYNILPVRHYFQMIFFVSLNYFSLHSKYLLKWCKPCVVYKTPLSYCFKVSYLSYIFYWFPSDINIYPAKTNLCWILTYLYWPFDPESLQIISIENTCES